MRNVFKRERSYPVASIAGSLVYSVPVGPGGGYGWGGGPRMFVGPSRGPTTAVELGAEGDFVEGDPSCGPLPGDLGFPHATRWPGYPRQWEQPFYATTGEFGGLTQSRVSTVFACTDLISRTLATMSLRVLSGNVPQLPPAWIENPEPAIYTSIVEAIQALINSLLHRGQAFAVPTARNTDNSVARWVVVNPDVTKVEQGPGGMPVYHVGELPVDRGDILHMRYQTWPGTVTGIGPLDACGRNLMSADALERWGTELAVTNGIPTAVLQAQAKLTLAKR